MSLTDLISIGSQEIFSSLVTELRLLRDEITRFREFFPKPFIFLKSGRATLDSNVAADVVILDGMRVPAGHMGYVEDFNVNFTTAAGTIQIVVVDANNNVRSNLLRTITSNTNGTGKTVLDEHERLAIIGQVAGAGVFGVFCTGTIQKVR